MKTSEESSGESPSDSREENEPARDDGSHSGFWANINYALAKTAEVSPSDRRIADLKAELECAMHRTIAAVMVRGWDEMTKTILEKHERSNTKRAIGFERNKDED